MNNNFNKFFEANKRMWNQKTPYHVKSEFYNLEKFKQGSTSLMPTELEELGEVSGKSILHLQCHFGQDSISLSRMGAKVTGVDFSDEAIIYAKNLAKELGVDTNFICANIYDLPHILDQQFDIVFTSYGTIGWLPNLNEWAKVIKHHLKSNGLFYMVEFHPYIMMFDDQHEFVEYSYFHTDEPIIDEYEGTYADRDAPLKCKGYGWNHPLSDVFSFLQKNKMTIKQFKEYPFSHYDCFLNMKEIGENKFVINKFGEKIPYMYSIKAIKG